MILAAWVAVIVAVDGLLGRVAHLRHSSSAEGFDTLNDLPEHRSRIIAAEAK